MMASVSDLVGSGYHLLWADAPNDVRDYLFLVRCVV